MAKINLERGLNESQAQYYKRLSKAADRRLRDLEKLSSQGKYANVKQWAYANAMYDLKALYGEKATRFDVKIPTTKDADIDQRRYMARINAVKRFLEAPSSLKSEIDIIYDKRADTLNKRYGTNFNWESVGKYFESGLHKKLDRLFGSKTAMKVIAKLQEKGIDVREAVHDIDLRTTRSDAGIAKAKASFMEKYELDNDMFYEGFSSVEEDELPF